MASDFGKSDVGGVGCLITSLCSLRKMRHETEQQQDMKREKAAAVARMEKKVPTKFFKCHRIEH